MNDCPRIVVERPDFRIVAVKAEGVEGYVLECPDGCDALGQERWRTFKLNSEPMRQLFSYLCQLVSEKER